MRTSKADPIRSALMGRVRQRGTAAELTVGHLLRSLGASYRLNVRALPGSPDFANRKWKWAVFVHGCFWHQHQGCRYATTPKTNRAFWLEKFKANRLRDARSARKLRADGYEVGLIWECQIDRPEQVTKKLSKILKARGVNVR